MREYRIYKAAGGELSALYDQARLRFARLPEELPPPREEADLADATTEGLLKAFLQALAGARDAEEGPKEQRVRQRANRQEEDEQQGQEPSYHRNHSFTLCTYSGHSDSPARRYFPDHSG